MNKDLQTKEYLKKLQDMKLSDSSRARMQDSLLEYARFHGVAEGVRVRDDGRSIEQVPKRTSFITNILNLNKKSMTAFIIAIALIAGGGTSYAAEGAVPGDFLYPIKTEVNENIKSTFAVSNEAEAKLQAQLAEERLEEAEELAARGELTAEAATSISSRLKAHYEDVEVRISKAEGKGDFEISSSVRASLEGSFRVYADVLADLNARVPGNSGESLITDIRTKANATADAQARSTTTFETSVNVKATTEATIQRTENLIVAVETKLARAETKLSAETHARLEARLGEAVAAQAEARASFRAEAYRAAYTNAQKAARVASEVDSMLNSALRLQIDVDVRTDRVINGIEIKVENEAQTDQRENTEPDSGTSADVEADVRTDVEVDTGVIDAGIRTDSNIGATLN